MNMVLNNISSPTPAPALPLLAIRPGLALVALYRVQHDLVGVVGAVTVEALAPVVTDSVGEDGSVRVECSGGDGTTHGWVTLEPVLGVLVPEVESAIAAGRAECAMLGVERNVVDRIYLCCVALGRVSVALEGEVGPLVLLVLCHSVYTRQLFDITYPASLSSTYWIAHRPSMLPIAKPVESVKQLTTRVCHFRGL